MGPYASVYIPMMIATGLLVVWRLYVTSSCAARVPGAWNLHCGRSDACAGTAGSEEEVEAESKFDSVSDIRNVWARACRFSTPCDVV
jgi:hypothetical protein